PAPKDTPKRKSRPTLACWVIRVWEANPPADVKEPLEWVLLCSLPAQTEEQIKEKRDWYGCRWLAEIYHDVEKNGCREEGGGVGRRIGGSRQPKGCGQAWRYWRWWRCEWCSCGWQCRRSRWRRRRKWRRSKR